MHEKVELYTIAVKATAVVSGNVGGGDNSKNYYKQMCEKRKQLFVK